MTEVPNEEGFWWGLWLSAAPGTADETDTDQWPAIEWEVMHVVENHSYDDKPDRLMVMVPGVQKWQGLSRFTWGPRVQQPAECPNAV